MAISIGCGPNDSGPSREGSAPAQTSQPSEQRRPFQGGVPDRLRSAIATTLKVDESKVTQGASFARDLGADDLGMVELVMAYEREFRIEIPNSDAARFQRVQDVVDYLQRRNVLR